MAVLSSRRERREKLKSLEFQLVLCLAQASLDVSEYSPSQIKQAATGRGNSNKDEVRIMVLRLLNLQAMAASVGPDQSDALACALCHAQHAPRAQRLAAL